MYSSISKVVGQSISFFIIFMIGKEAVAEMSAYLSAGGGNKIQACAHIRLSCRCFPAAYNISLRNFAAAKSSDVCVCVKKKTSDSSKK